MTSIRDAKKFGLKDFADGKDEIGIPVTLRADIPADVLQEIGIDLEPVDIRGMDGRMTNEDAYRGAWGETCSDCTFDVARGRHASSVTYLIPTRWLVKKECA